MPDTIGGMSDLFPTEFPSLLPVGFHRMTMKALRQLCVDGFPLSERRPALMVGLEKVVGKLTESNINGDLWIDGSFLTKKIEPDDVDFTLRLDSVLCDKMTEDQFRTIQLVNSPTYLKASYQCHGFVWITYPEDDQRYWEGEWQRAYWIRQWGFSRGQDKKGIALIKLPEDAA
jgi:hypothetical protein